MKSLNESIATAMDFNNDVEIIPFLPYILQDFWELGTPADTVMGIIRKYSKNYEALKIVDLGCGKGAVCVKAAATFGCRCYGIDGMPAFIKEAEQKAIQYGVESLCRFEAGDIRKKINEIGQYDIIVLGAIGQVFGDYYVTLSKLSHNMMPEGIIILNDAYMDDTSTLRHPAVLARSELMRQIGSAGMRVIEEIEDTDPAGTAESYDNEMKCIIKRCGELAAKYPDKAALFDNYIKAQKEEYGVLESEILSPVIVIARK